MDVGRGVTKDRRTIYIYIYIYIALAQFIPVYVGLAQARPNYQMHKIKKLLNVKILSIQNVVPESAPEAMSGSPKCRNFLGEHARRSAPPPKRLCAWKTVLPPPRFLNEGLSISFPFFSYVPFLSLCFFRITKIFTIRHWVTYLYL